jgi:hypothetical protein
MVCTSPSAICWKPKSGFHARRQPEAKVALGPWICWSIEM